MTVIDKIPDKIPAQRSTEPHDPSIATHGTGIADASLGTPIGRDDGTRALLQAGLWITLAAVLALIATKTLFGGMGIHGPHTNSGWLSFMFALMGIPFGLMLLALGSAKWLRNRRLRFR